MPEISWDDFDTEAEAVTEEDVKEIEEGPRGGFVGRAICVCIGSTPKQIEFRHAGYSCIGTTLKFEIEKVLEIGVKQFPAPPKSDTDYVMVFEPATPGMSEPWEGETITDDVAFSNEKEKPAMGKRRKMVALKLGLIKPGEQILKSMWRDDIIGKRVIITTEENRYEKDGVTKIGRPQVNFFNGYESVESGNETADKFDDI